MADINPLIGDLGISPPAQEDNPLISDLGIQAKAPPSQDSGDTKPDSEEWNKMGLIDKNIAVAKAAPRWLMEGTGQLADTATDLLQNAFSEGESQDVGKHPVFQAIAHEVANRLNLPKTPDSKSGRIIGAGVKALPSAVVAGPEAFVPSLAPTALSGAASQAAAEAGAGPVVQTAAGLSPFAATAGAGLVRGLVRGGGAGAANMEHNLSNAENAGIKLSAGQAADNGALKAAETLGSKIPGGGGLAETRGAGLNHQIEESVSNITKKLAPDLNQKPPTPTAAGETVQTGVKKRLEGLKDETNEAADAMHAVVPKETPMAAPRFEATIAKVTNPTGIQAVDDLVTGSKTKAVAKVADKVSSENARTPTGYSADGEGAHVATSPNGETHAVEQANGDLKVTRSDTSPAAQGKGEGTDRLETLAHAATGKGKNLVSDISVSPAEAAAYEKLRARGWAVEKNPNAEVNPDTKNTISDSPKNPVYTVKAPSTEKTPGAGAPKQSAESHFSGEWTYNPKTGKSEPVTEAPTPSGPTDQTKAQLNPETPWTFDSLRQLRTAVGKELRPGVSDTRQGQLKQLYGALSEDLKAGVKTKGPEAEQAYDLFNHVATQNGATQRVLVRAVKSLGGPEAVFKAAMAGTKDGATKIAPIMGSLDEEGKNLFRATVLHRLGRAGGAADAPFDANTFLKNWKGMSPEGKNMLFGEGASAGPPTQLRKSLDALNDSLDLLSKQGYIKSGFVKGVEQGSHGLRNVGIMGALALLAEHSGTAVMHVATGHPFLAAGAVTGAAGILAGNPAMSRILTNPKTVGWLAQATKAPKGMVPVLINQLNRMGDRDPDAKDLSNLIGGMSASAGPKDTGVLEHQGTIYPKINRSAGMQPLPGGGYGIPPESM